jgi:signal transduction histidine kinase
LGFGVTEHAVQCHHGKIAAERDRNKGASISVRFDTRV